MDGAGQRPRHQKLTTRLVVYIPFVKLLPLRRTGGVGFLFPRKPDSNHRAPTSAIGQQGGLP
jgi:hypothetical protein